MKRVAIVFPCATVAGAIVSERREQPLSLEVKKRYHYYFMRCFDCVLIVAFRCAVVTLMEALNRCYGVRETRRFWARWGLAVLTTAVAGVTGLLALGVAFLGPSVAAHVGGSFGLAVRWARLPIAALLVTLLWAFMYWALPNVKTRFRLFTPGALVGALLWVAASAGLNAYVRWSPTYEITYGALGGVIVMLLWMWLSWSAVLIGAEINKVLTSTEPLQSSEAAKVRQGKQSNQAALPRTTDAPPGIPA